MIVNYPKRKDVTSYNTIKKKESVYYSETEILTLFDCKTLQNILNLPLFNKVTLDIVEVCGVNTKIKERNCFAYGYTGVFYESYISSFGSGYLDIYHTPKSALLGFLTYAYDDFKKYKLIR